MNFAFPALLAVVYIIPGIVLSNAFFVSLRALNSGPPPDWSSRIGYGTISAVPLHYILICLFCWLNPILSIDVFPDPEIALKLLADRDGTQSNNIIHSIATDSHWIALYFFFANLIAWLIGTGFGAILAPIAPIILGKSPWDRVLDEEVENVQDVFSGNLQRLFITAVVERGVQLYLYNGFYADKILDEKKILRGIWLTSPKWRLITSNDANYTEDQEESEFRGIAADCLFLAFDKVQSMTCKVADFRTIYKKSEYVAAVAKDIFEERAKQKIEGSAEDDWKRAEEIYALKADHYKKIEKRKKDADLSQLEKAIRSRPFVP